LSGILVTYWRTMVKKKRKRTPEQIARTEEVMRKVQERIAYHTQKLAEERAAKEQSSS
jgi:hypothetical protein